MRISPLPSLLLAALLLAGCSSQPRVEHAPAEATLDSNQVKQALYAQYRQWRGVPYRMGGMSRSGVDCSGFVSLTYEEILGIQLPRSTEEQVEAGHPVPKRDLAPGDLVFFRTGINTRHVGMYIGDGNFLHASTERGVMISSLANPYWASAYWKAVRITRDDSPLSAAR